MHFFILSVCLSFCIDIMGSPIDSAVSNDLNLEDVAIDADWGAKVASNNVEEPFTENNSDSQSSPDSPIYVATSKQISTTHPISNSLVAQKSQVRDCKKKSAGLSHIECKLTGIDCMYRV